MFMAIAGSISMMIGYSHSPHREYKERKAEVDAANAKEQERLTTVVPSQIDAMQAELLKM